MHLHLKEDISTLLPQEQSAVSVSWSLRYCGCELGMGFSIVLIQHQFKRPLCPES